MMRIFNPFAFFYYASVAELDSAVSYLRDCLDAQDREVQPPPSGAELEEAGSSGHPIERIRRRVEDR
ncbi:hypothetical protein ACFY36_11255 [Actinoplanes sp. NPDC000266]